MFVAWAENCYRKQLPIISATLRIHDPEQNLLPLFELVLDIFQNVIFIIM